MLVGSRGRTRLCGRDVRPGLARNGALTFTRNFGVRFNYVAPPGGMGIVVITPGNPKRAMHDRCRVKGNIPYLVTIRRSTANSTLSLNLTCTLNVNNTETNMLRAAFEARARASLFNRRTILYKNIYTLVRTNFRALARTNCSPEGTCFRYVRRVGLVISLVCRDNFRNVECSVSGATRCNSCVANPGVVARSAGGTVGGILSSVRSNAFTGSFLLSVSSTNDRMRFGTVHGLTTRRPDRGINRSVHGLCD